MIKRNNLKIKKRQEMLKMKEYKLMIFKSKNKWKWKEKRKKLQLSPIIWAKNKSTQDRLINDFFYNNALNSLIILHKNRI